MASAVGTTILPHSCASQEVVDLARLSVKFGGALRTWCSFLCCAGIAPGHLGSAPGLASQGLDTLSKAIQTLSARLFTSEYMQPYR